MLFHDRSRTRVDNEQQSRGGAQGVVTQEAPGEQGTLPYAPTPSPRESRVPLVPAPLSPTLLPAASEEKKLTQPARGPVIVPRSGKKSVGTMRPPKGRRMVVHLGVCVSLVVIVLSALAAVLPTSSDGKANGFGILQPIMNMVTSKKNDTALIAAQAATATAVTQDGFDAGNQTYAGVQSAPSTTTGNVPPSDAGSLSRFFYGQCTYWANMRYQQLTGHYVPWLGNAYQWAYAAPSYGWVMSSEPNPNGPSIIVIGPGTQGAGWYGHVAVVENGVANASNGVMTSNWNWNGHWAGLDWVRFYPGPGIHFLWYPGS